ncbi:hypothetical protein JCM11641_000156 [Rhodosporidiobolus odoratus]
MPDLAHTGSSLSARLAEPLSSVPQLLDLLVPPLQALSLLPDLPALSSCSSTASADIDSSRFVKRQLGFVQKVLVERVWPDWEGPLEADEGAEGIKVLERWFIPPLKAGSLNRSDDASSAASAAAAEVALSAYAVLSSLLSAKSAAGLRPRSLEIASQLLIRLSTDFGVEQVYLATLGSPAKAALTSSGSDDEDSADPAFLARWDDTLKELLRLPTRVANAWGALHEKKKVPLHQPGLGVPPELEDRPYFATFTKSYLSLLWYLASDSSVPAYHSALSSALAPLLSSSTFLTTALPILIPRFLPPSTFPTPPEELVQRRRHIDIWRAVTAELSERDLSRFLRAVLRALEKDVSHVASADPTSAARAVAFVLDALFGPLAPIKTELWRTALAVLLERNSSWNSPLVPLAVVLWVGREEEASIELMQAAMRAWGAREELQSANDARRLYLTSLLLLSIASLPSLHPAVVALSRSLVFLSAVSNHLSLVAPLQRLLGMLVAEIVSTRTIPPDGELKPLSFGDEIWGGDGREQLVVRKLRELFEEVSAGKVDKVVGWQDLLRQVSGTTCPPQPPQPASAPKVNSKPLQPSSVEESPAAPPKRPLISIIGADDSDDDLEAYPLPPAPSDSTLEVLNSDDPALYHSAFPSQQAATSGPGGGASQTRKRGRLRPPVYVPELVAYLKGQDPEGGKEEADGQAERVEMGLKEGEGLVRRKAGWGGELKENAVDLAFALMALQDQFELVNFDQLKQNILVALATACPTEIAPCVIEQYFTPSYSLAQRNTLLASLAISARELANLPIPVTPTTPAKPQPSLPLFPSKQLPPAMHRKLLGYAPGEQLGALETLTADLTRIALSDTREDAEATVPGAAREKLLNVRRTTTRSSASTAASRTTIASPSKPTFSLLAAEIFILPLINRFWLYLRDTATSSLSHTSNVGPYAGGTSVATLLQPYLLSKFLATLSVILHAAQFSPAFLAVLVPETLTLALGLKPSAPAPHSRRGADSELEDAELNQDAVLSASLELVLVALDATVQLDGGRTIMSSSVNGGSSLVAEVKDWAEEVFEAEERKGSEGGVGRTGRAAAGVLLRVEEIVGRWRGQVGW